MASIGATATWSCSLCGHDNSATVLHCENCDAERPGGNAAPVLNAPGVASTAPPGVLHREATHPAPRALRSPESSVEQVEPESRGAALQELPAQRTGTRWLVATCRAILILAPVVVLGDLVKTAANHGVPRALALLPPGAAVPGIIMLVLAVVIALMRDPRWLAFGSAALTGGAWIILTRGSYDLALLVSSSPRLRH